MDIISLINDVMGWAIWNFIGAMALFGVVLSNWKKNRELKQKILAMGKKNGTLSKHPIAIVIGVGKNPSGSVKNFLIDKGWANIAVLSWVYEGFLSPSEYTTAMTQINDLRKQALELGASEVLLFYAGPVDLSIFIGASYDNWVPVRVYAYANGTYEHRYTLEREAARMEKLQDKIGREV